MKKVRQTGTRTALVARLVARPKHTLIILESNVPGKYYCIEETDNDTRVCTRARLKNAQELLEQYGIDLYQPIA